MATFCGFFPSFFRRTRRAIPGLVVAAMLSGCNTGGSTPDTVQVSTPSTPGDPAPAPPPGGSNADTTSPTVSISSPASGSVVAGTVSVHADATDPVVAGQTTSGIAGVQLQVNGQNVGDLETGAPYSASFDTTSVADGVYQVRAIARDGAGNQTTSAAVAVTVRNASPPPTPPPSGTDTTKPTITIESPTTSSAYSATSASLTLGGKASDNIGVTQLTWSNNQGGSGNATLASGNWTAGNIALKANASNVITVTARDAAGNAQTDTISVSYATTPPPTPSPADSNILRIPSLDDERSTYAKWGWMWTASDEPAAVTEPVANYYISLTPDDLQYDTEADDLWSYLMMYRRTGNTVYLNRAQAWLRYFKEEYRENLVANREFAHLYGWGLLAWYEHTCAEGACDVAALAAAQGIGVEVENYWHNVISESFPMATWGIRIGARSLLFATRLAVVTNDQRWIALRDHLIDRWLRSSDWDARGMYFGGQDLVDAVVGAGAYDAGYRVMSSFQVGILADAFYQAYRITGRQELRDRLVAMAAFIDQYGLDPANQYTGSYFGVTPDGKPWHKFEASAYTTSLVNTLVIRYKLSGEKSYYDRAKYFFNRGTKGEYGSTNRLAGDSEVHHFVDTRFSTSEPDYLAYNKGELQYTYMLFENGGLP